MRSEVTPAIVCVDVWVDVCERAAPFGGSCDCVIERICVSSVRSTRRYVYVSALLGFVVCSIFSDDKRSLYVFVYSVTHKVSLSLSLSLYVSVCVTQ